MNTKARASTDWKPPAGMQVAITLVRLVKGSGDVAQAVFGGLGFTLAIVIMAGIREELAFRDAIQPIRTVGVFQESSDSRSGGFLSIDRTERDDSIIVLGEDVVGGHLEIVVADLEARIERHDAGLALAQQRLVHCRALGGQRHGALHGLGQGLLQQPADAQGQRESQHWNPHQMAAEHGLRAETAAPASADASFRRYLRVQDDQGGTRIIMDAPPAHENCQPFVAIDRLLRAGGVGVPDILAWDEPQGFMLLSDLGMHTLLSTLAPEAEPWSEQDRDNLARYHAASDELIRLQGLAVQDQVPPFPSAQAAAEIERSRCPSISTCVGNFTDSPKGLP